jgi:hypothetical protein
LNETGFSLLSTAAVENVQGQQIITQNTRRKLCRKKKMLSPQNYRVESSKCSTTTDVWFDVNSMHEEMKQNQIDKPDFLNEIEISDEDF